MSINGQLYQIDEIVVDPSASSVRRLGEEHILRYQTFRVLVYLLHNPGKLISKHELNSEIWPDANVTDNALTQCIAEIRRALGDDSRHPRYIRTASKVGYQFLAPVIVVPAAIHHEEHPAPLALPPSPVPSGPTLVPRSAVSTLSMKVLSLSAAAILIVIAAGLLARATQRTPQRSAPVAALTNGRSLAVLYFENETRRHDLDWLRQGLTDMMISDLSRSGGLQVLSRQDLSQLMNEQSALAAQDSVQLGLKIAQNVHATDFLTGSFCEMDKQFRIDVQVHDALSGRVIFADHSTFQNSSDILSQVDTVAEHLANAMELNSDIKPNIARVTTKDVQAYQYYSLGVEKAQEFETVRAISLLKQAVALDPGFAMAYARIGYVYAVTDVAHAKGRPYLETALRLSDRLSAKDRLSIQAWYAISKGDYGTASAILNHISHAYPQDTEAHWRLAGLLRAQERPREALAILHHGLETNPNEKNLNNSLGFVLLSLHRYPEAIEAFQRYVFVAPDEPNAHDSLGVAYEQSGNYGLALSEYQKALSLDSEFEPAIVHLGDVFYQTGQFSHAVEQYQRYAQVAQTNDAKSLAYSDLAKVYLATNQLDQAERFAYEELKNNPDAVWDSLVIALKESDQNRAARLQNILFKDIPTQERGTPGDQRTRFYYRGYIELHEGDVAAALADFRRALQHLPPTSGMDSYEDCLANAELQIGQYQQAASDYERILSFNPNYPQARLHLAEAEAHLMEKGRSDRHASPGTGEALLTYPSHHFN